MPNPIIERAAQALLAKMSERILATPEECVLAVLRAIREPSEAMVEAGSQPFNGDLVTKRGASDIWQAMISAALDETTVTLSMAQQGGAFTQESFLST